MRKLLFIFTLMFLLSLGAGEKCEIKPDRLSEDAEASVHVTGDTSDINMVKMIFSPGSEVEHIVLYQYVKDLKVIPPRAGIVKISAVDKKENELCSKMASVHFSGVPWAGIIIFLIAGSILMTGTVLSLKKAFKSEDQ